MNWTRSDVNYTNAKRVMLLWLILLYVTMTMVSHLKFFYSGKNTISSCTEVIDPRLLRNERDRARRASIPSNKREEINRKHHELYQRKKEQPMLFEPNNGGTTCIFLNIYIQYISHCSYIVLKYFCRWWAVKKQRIGRSC
jgi:hypothetical protein